MSLYSTRNNYNDYNDEYDYGRANAPDDDKDGDDQYGGYANTYNNGSDDEQNVDEKGFEKRMEGDEDIFVFKKIQLPGIGRN